MYLKKIVKQIKARISKGVFLEKVLLFIFLFLTIILFFYFFSDKRDRSSIDQDYDSTEDNQNILKFITAPSSADKENIDPKVLESITAPKDAQTENAILNTSGINAPKPRELPE